MNKVLAFIELIKGSPAPTGHYFTEDDTSRGIITEIYTQGNCGNFAKALALAFDGDVLVVEGFIHAICRINGRLYDISGDVTDKFPNVREPMVGELDDLTNNYSFSDRGPMI